MIVTAKIAQFELSDLLFSLAKIRVTSRIDMPTSLIIAVHTNAPSATFARSRSGIARIASNCADARV